MDRPHCLCRILFTLDTPWRVIPSSRRRALVNRLVGAGRPIDNPVRGSCSHVQRLIERAIHVVHALLHEFDLCLCEDALHYRYCLCKYGLAMIRVGDEVRACIRTIGVRVLDIVDVYL